MAATAACPREATMNVSTITTSTAKTFSSTEGHARPMVSRSDFLSLAFITKSNGHPIIIKLQCVKERITISVDDINLFYPAFCISVF